MRSAADYTVQSLSKDRSREGVESLVEALHVSASGSLPMQGSCATCVNRNFPAAVLSELLPIQKVIDAQSEQIKEELHSRAQQYRAQTLPFRDGRLHLAQPSCPFLREGGCLLGESRPFGCRLGRGAEADARITALGIGHMVGLYMAGLDHRQVELGLAIPWLLGNSNWVDEFLSGRKVLWEAAINSFGRDVVVELGKSFLGRREPSGFPDDLLSVADCHRVIDESGFEKAVSVLKGTSAVEQFYRIQVPFAYDSEDEISEWREYFVRTMREVAQMRFDPVEAFDALEARRTFPLAYHGRDVKEILVEHARTIVEPTVARALPDLVQPIEARRRPGPIRVGYISRSIGFSNGSIWSLGWIRNHGQDIESYVFALSEREDRSNVQFRQAADHYFYVPGDVLSTARFIKGLDLDVLIFTDIGMAPFNYMYAGMRLARVQCTAWGHPVTSGLSTIDYYLSSELMEPPEGDSHYSERLIRLPGSGLFLERPELPVSTKSRADFGLPEGFLIGMVQNPMKCIPRWDSLLAEVGEGAKMVFIEHRAPSVNNKTKQRLERLGIDAVWLPPMSPTDFFEMLGLLDVVIDPPAWSGGNTTVQALALGKPVITMPGEFMRGRHGLAFLKQAGMDSLVAASSQEFARLAGNRDLQRSTVTEAEPGAIFEDRAVVKALNDWIEVLALA